MSAFFCLRGASRYRPSRNLLVLQTEVRNVGFKIDASYHSKARRKCRAKSHVALFSHREFNNPLVSISSYRWQEILHKVDIEPTPQMISRETKLSKLAWSIENSD